MTNLPFLSKMPKPNDVHSYTITNRFIIALTHTIPGDILVTDPSWSPGAAQGGGPSRAQRCTADSRIDFHSFLRRWWPAWVAVNTQSMALWLRKRRVLFFLKRERTRIYRHNQRRGRQGEPQPCTIQTRWMVPPPPYVSSTAQGPLQCQWQPQPMWLQETHTYIKYTTAADTVSSMIEDDKWGHIASQADSPKA